MIFRLPEPVIMRRFILFMAMLACSCTVSGAGNAVPEIPLAYTDEPLVPDGCATEKSWHQVPWNEPFMKTVKPGRPAREQTRFKILGSRNGIWIFLECMDSRVKTQTRPLDDAVWHDDCVELFFSPSAEVSPDLNVREYYQIVVNPSGSVFDTFCRGGAASNQWQSMIKTAGKIVPGGWHLELYIPYAAFPNVRGGTWRFLCGRENHGKGCELSAFPETGNFEDMDRYARLEGIRIDPERFSNTLTSFSLNAEPGIHNTVCFARGSMKTRLRGRVGLKCRISDSNGKPVDFADDLVMPRNGILSFDIPVRITRSGKYRCRLLLTDEHGLVFAADAVRNIEIAPCSVEMTHPFYRNNIYSSMADKTARFRITPKVSPEYFKKCRIEAEIRQADGKVLLHKGSLSATELRSFEVPLANASCGKITAAFTMYHGAKVLGRFEKVINLLPPLTGGNEVWLNSDRCLVVNGNLFYPRGFLGAAGSSFPVIAQAGGNVVHSYTINFQPLPQIIKYLDLARKNGLKVILKYCYRYDNDFWGFNIGKKKTAVFEPGLRKLAGELIREIQNHPALLAWYLYDEPRGTEYTRSLQQVYDFLRENDPYHPVIGCDNSSGGCIDKAGFCDIHWIDIYPGPRSAPADSMTVPLVSVYNQLADAVGKLDREGICYVPQAFEFRSFQKDRKDLRSMTFAELRASVFAGITAGVRGTIPYKIGDINTRYGQFVPNAGIFSNPHMKLGYLKGIIPELRALEKPLLSPVAAKQASADNRDIRLITFDCGDSIYVFAVNLIPTALGMVNITWPNRNVHQVHLLGNNGKVTVRENAVSINFGKYDAFVLTDDPKAASAINIPRLEKEIKQALKTLDHQ